MAITYPLALPEGPITSVRMVAMDAVAYTSSPFTFQGQAHDWGGQGWRMQVQTSPMKRETAENWVAFLVSLRGQFGTFLMGDPAGAAPRGSAGGTPAVKGAGQTGQVLNIDGAAVSQTGWLLAGDYIQLGAGSSATLHKVLADADSDGAGEVTLDIWPGIRTAPSDNAPLALTDTVGRWRLASNEREWSISSAAIYGIQFSAMEAI